MILHGLPNHPYFAIAQPPSFKAPEANSEGAVIIELQDPKTKEITWAVLVDTWRLSIDEFLPARAFSRLIYGIEPDKLLKVLIKRYPEIEEKQTIHFLLLKKL